MRQDHYKNNSESYETEELNFDEIMRGANFQENYNGAYDSGFSSSEFRGDCEESQFGQGYETEYSQGYGEEYAQGYGEEYGKEYGEGVNSNFGGNGFGQNSFQGASGNTGATAYSNGRNRVFNRRRNINGASSAVVNRDFYNNYYNRYNNYYVKNQRVNRDFVYDYNIVHVSSENYYGGCNNIGSGCCIKRGRCGGRRCCRRRRSC